MNRSVDRTTTRLVIAALLALLSVGVPLAPPFAPPAARAAGPVCTTSGPTSGAYTATVCLSTSGTTTLSGEVTVTTTVTAASGAMPAVDEVKVSLARGTSTSFSSALTDYAAPFSFKLPTARWVDGDYKLRSEVTVVDGFVASLPVVSMTFANGVTVAPRSSG